MTKKDFELIAETIQELHTGIPSLVTLDELEAIAATFATSLARTNGMFNRDRFLRACVPGANVRARS